MKIAFYAPIKPPDHPIPSGDRLIARNLVAALKLAGHDVSVASSFIAYSKRADDDILKQRKRDALAEADRLLDAFKGDPPDLWITYHPYCKAPDWIGPTVSSAIGIPYWTVEAARTGQGFENGGDLWAAWRAEAQAGIRAADLHLCFKPTDRAYLEDLLGSDERIADIAPFIDTHVPDDLPEIDLPNHWRSDWPIIVTTGMMRPGKKVENFRILAEALTPLQSLHWTLLIIGGGPEFEQIRGFFDQIEPHRVCFTGAIEQKSVLFGMKQADLFVWPGWREPIGMVYLEAQLMGLPVAAFSSMGVPLVVRHGETGLLAKENDIKGLSENIAQLLSHPELRRDFARNATSSVLNNHSLQSAAARLNSLLQQYLAA